MGGPRSTASREEILAAFHTDEGFKAVSSRIGMSPNTLRVLWKEAFGDKAFTTRGKNLQARVASETCRNRDHSRDVFKEVSVPCSQCGTGIVMKINQAAQTDMTTFVCDGCRCDRKCPVCDFPVDGQRGLSMHFRHRREAGDTAHVTYLEEREEARWTDKIDGVDHVTCLVCGHRAETLARHLKAVHGITAVEYRYRFGNGSRIRSEKLEAARSHSAKARRGGFGKGGKKILSCCSCGVVRAVSKFFAPGMHDARCDECRAREEALVEEARWVGKTEPGDYVTCLDCGHRADNLTSHFQNAHPDYRERHPSALVVALDSTVRDKTALRGLVRPPGFGRKVSEAKLLNIRPEEFGPYLEPDGTVDHRAMTKAVGCSLPTLIRYMDGLGLRTTRKYIEQAGVERRVVLTVTELESYKLANGKVSIARAVAGTGLCNVTVKKECQRHGLKWAHGNVSQRLCLEAISEALGTVSFHEEWMSMRFVSPFSGRRFRFDGYFLDVGLVVEFQGSFHYTFPNAFMLHESYRPLWEQMRERDRIKQEMIEASSDLTYLAVLEDEPFMDVAYLQGRLIEVGVLEVRSGGIWCGDRLVRASNDAGASEHEDSPLQGWAV